jgi:molecular chaperone GrpE (heat shock protein)
MRFLVRVVLGGVVLAAALVGQEGNLITLGDGENPSIEPRQLAVPLKDGKAFFEIDTAKARGIDFRATAGSPAIVCDQQQIALDHWYRIKATTRCTVKAKDKASVNMKVLNAAASDVMKLRAKDQTSGQIAVGEEMAKGATTISLVFEPLPGAPARNPTPTSATQHSGTDNTVAKRTPILPYITLAIALMAILIASMSLFRRTSAPPATTSANDPDSPIAEQRLRDLSTNLNTLQLQIKKNEAQQQAISADISTRASQKDMAALQQTLDQQMRKIQDALNDLQSSQNGTVNHLGTDLAAVQSELQRHNQVLEQLRAGASDKLVSLLATLPESYLAGTASEDTARLLDQAVSDFFAQSVPSRDGLKPNKERAQSLDAAIGTLCDQIAPQFPDATKRLKPLIEQARQIQSEIGDLENVAESKSLKLRFEVNFYASKANREGLMSGIASGIKDQIVKVEKPVEYFDRRLRALAAAAAQTTADFLDANVDLKRSDARIQGMLQDILNAAGVEQIAPAANDEFRAAEHAVVQVTPRPGGAAGAPAVARLVARGFRQGNQVVRKASVILYE